MTPVASFPVGFAFYYPDPILKVWKKEDDRLIKKKIPKKQRPPEPKGDPQYPTKVQLSLQLLEGFRKAILIFKSNLFWQMGFMLMLNLLIMPPLIFGDNQVVTKMKYNQNERFEGRLISVEDYFLLHPLVSQEISVRGK